MQTSFKIPKGIAQLLSVQSNGSTQHRGNMPHPPNPSPSVKKSLTTANDRGRKRVPAVGVCYLSPPKKMKSGQNDVETERESGEGVEDKAAGENGAKRDSSGAEIAVSVRLV